MTNEELKSLDIIKENTQFKNIIHKLTINKQLDYNEKTFILAIAIAFIQEYDKNNKFTTYLEFAYYIILKYSTFYNDYKPLYDFSTEFGFFPISKFILENNMIKNQSLKDVLIGCEIDNFKYEDKYTQTLEQYNSYKDILNSNDKETAFIAPTSYGKSSIIIDLIKKNLTENVKIGIIVPSKSLITQTYKLVKKMLFNRKILLHDEMYDGEKSFIAIFTQERALRLLKQSEKLHFDILFIDEAHNIFKKDSRSRLLSRLIKRNLQRNINCKNIYLSPLISNSNKLAVVDNQNIIEQKIDFNIKEAEIFEYLENKIVRKYNRFTNEFYNISKSDNYINYLKTNSHLKNFIYIKNPRKVEIFSEKLSNNLDNSNPDIDELAETLKHYIHDNFYLIDYIYKGVIYLHGNLPDIIKEYLEFKFNHLTSLKYLVANSVVLEGINFPIDNMFILNVHELSEKELTNLIGRVNRLNEVFLDKNKNLNKLLPPIHFINNEQFNRKNGKMENAIKKLRSRIFEDKIKNPTLDSYDFKQLDIDIEKAKKSKSKEKEKILQQRINHKNQILKVVSFENFLTEKTTTDKERLKKYLIENDISSFYNNIDDILDNLLQNISKYSNHYRWKKLRVIDKVYYLFIFNYLNDISNQKYEFERLKEKKARNYYDTFIKLSHSMNLKERINNTFSYFKKIQNLDDTTLYIGHSYGEVCKETKRYDKKKFNVYIDLSKKEDIDLINIAIVKIQMEEKFVNYSINRFVEMLNDYKLITEEEYNLHIYGTKELKNINFVKFGLSSGLINRLEEDNQLKNIKITDNGLEYNQEFKNFLNDIDDFYKFQIEKYIPIDFLK